MNFVLSEEHTMARTLFRTFAENEVKPLAQELDEQERFPTETVEKMAAYGFLGIPVPKEWGGQGADTLAYAICVEELSRVCATTGVIVSAHTSLCADPIRKYGTQEQKEKYLPKLCSGEWLGAYGAGGGHRCGGPADKGCPAGRPLYIKRHQNIYHQRWCGGHICYFCHDGQI